MTCSDVEEPVSGHAFSAIALFSWVNTENGRVPKQPWLDEFPAKHQSAAPHDWGIDIY